MINYITRVFILNFNDQEVKVYLLKKLDAISRVYMYYCRTPRMPSHLKAEATTISAVFKFYIHTVFKFIDVWGGVGIYYRRGHWYAGLCGSVVLVCTGWEGLDSEHNRERM